MMTTELHPFEVAGYGPGPYLERGIIEDTSLGLCCDACGKQGLKSKFQLLSSTDQLFGVGSECIKKADATLWLEMKSRVGAKSNITKTAIERRDAYDAAHALFNEYKRINPDSWYLREYKCGKEFDEVKRVRVATFEKEAEQIKERIALEKRIAEQRAGSDQVLHEKVKQISKLYLERLRNGTLPAAMSDFYKKLAHHCAENSRVTDYMRYNEYNLRSVLSYLTQA